MKHAVVTLWGKYKYKIKIKDTDTMHDIAMKIALEVHKGEGKTKFTSKPRTYNYIYECLLRKSCLNFRINTEDNANNEQELLNCANELNSQSEFIKKIDENGIEYYEHQDYRLGYTQSNTLIIDVDGKDRVNLINVKTFYENVLNCKFTVIGTKKGYWLFSNHKYDTLNEWIFDNCRVLSPYLERQAFKEYRTNLLALDEKTPGEFNRATPDVITKSWYYKAPKNLNFDVAFTFLSIKRERSTIRITKKGKDDKIELINI